MVPWWGFFLNSLFFFVHWISQSMGITVQSAHNTGMCLSPPILPKILYTVQPLKHGCKLYVVDIFPLPQLPLSICGSGIISIHCMVREGMRQQELGRPSKWVCNNSCRQWGYMKIFRKRHCDALEHLPLKWQEFSERGGSNKHIDGCRWCSFLLCKVRTWIGSSSGTQYARCFIVQHPTCTYYQTSCFKV